MKRRITALFLALTLLCAILPTALFTVSAEEMSGTCGKNLTWSYDEATKTLTISGNGDMDNYSWGAAPWYIFVKSIQEVIFFGNMLSIGRFAFSDCSGLTSVTIPDSVTSIGECAFASCTGLTSVMLGNSVTCLASGAFSDCSSLESVTIPAGLTWLGDFVLGRCDSLKNVFFGGTQGQWYTFLRNGMNGSFPGVMIHFEVSDLKSHCHLDASTVPSCIRGGVSSYSCPCGYTWEETTTPALGHDYVNGICSRCGEESPSTGDITMFIDVKPTDWFYDAVWFVTETKLFNGVGENKFAPNTAMDRAMLVTVLWRYAGEPKKGTNSFTDVPNGQWYTDAVAWASSNGIVGGVGNGKFDPNGNVTREQMAAILFRYCNTGNYNTERRGDLSGFPDAGDVNSWAKDAYEWAVGGGLIGGNKIDGQTLLDPQGNATRAQVATILWRFVCIIEA